MNIPNVRVLLLCVRPENRPLCLLDLINNKSRILSNKALSLHKLKQCTHTCTTSNIAKRTSWNTICVPIFIKIIILFSQINVKSMITFKTSVINASAAVMEGGFARTDR